MLQQGFNLGCKQKGVVSATVIKWLFPHPIACDKQFSLNIIPNRECEHASQMFDAAITKFFVQMNNDFGVAVGFLAYARAEATHCEAQRSYKSHRLE